MENQVIYRFNPVGDRNGQPANNHYLFTDKQDFTINPVLLKQLQLDTCPETTPEGRALWIYIRLCQVLRYDETYFFNDTCKNLNHEADDSFQLVETVTAETPVTCFNFSRIAVKLLNQIQGVQAVLIATGCNYGHMRFGFYTDKVTVDADPTNPTNHFTDMARIKLGMKPQCLNTIYGQEVIETLMPGIVKYMLAEARQNLQAIFDNLKKIFVSQETTALDVKSIVDDLAQTGVDGNSIIQLLNNINHQFDKQPFLLMRAGIVNAVGKIEPQLLVRRERTLTRIDLQTMKIFNLPTSDYFAMMAKETMVHADLPDNIDEEKKENIRFNFSRGLETKPLQSTERQI